MKRILSILVFILMYLLFSAKSCDNMEQDDAARDQARITSAQDSIKSTFTPDTLNGVSLRAFEAAARIRFCDFSDYLSILRDTTTARPFREKAREMIRGCFYTGKSVLRVKIPGRSRDMEVSVNQLLMAGNECSFPCGRMIADSVKVIKTLERADDSSYTGTLGYPCFSSGGKDIIKLKMVPGHGTVGFLVIKHEKTFGKDTLRVWDVFLGDSE